MRSLKKKFASAVAVTSVALLALTACGSGSGSEGEAEAGSFPLNEGKLTICSDIPYEPFEFVKDGKNVGFDMDIAAEIAKDAELDLNVIDASFDSIESGLFNTQCDIAISSISITEERSAKMDFSTPYMDDDLVLISADGSGIKDLESAKDKKVGVQQATTGEKYAKEQGLTNIVGFEDAGLQTQALLAGQVDALLGNQSVLGYSIKDKEGFSVVADFKTGEQLGVAVPKDQPKTLELVNGTLKRLTDAGTMEELTVKWFGEK
ncbi:MULTISPECIES: ABC transporter substrate-binding protein [Glutamicibacter]|uniref:Amino acid ABC transporter substrate-binding protein (PAAT family) n=1 Tax=Glutamicibacter mysorens TaxID=257984 RepID=A0ABX4MYT5_9MICC|nr:MULTISPECIES: ABC transporter substrate-binding protein [Glutamicibacter]KWR70805.1 ABC transporter substrate-binding protein [Arthrobacter sp. W1]MDV2976701.1 ABC transporter substrate-binding protein [Actinomycetes bacterium ARC8]PJJ44536.1 amino acid ABC transporter substrate-binding protein (PAAT family) [Glutamicibacter mysorens]QEP07878.1 amino acid ABC transporter substrate-binding protein [Glutamicibacter sp. ZJUTW]UTM46567.1 ABC transporter substrate-binding protein [Glutamicibacte